MAGFAFRAQISGGGAHWNGPGFIAGRAPGLVTVNSAPARRLVFALDRASKLVARSAWSASDGSYRLDCLNPHSQFDIIGRDYTGTYEDVIVSRVQPVTYELSLAGAFAADDALNVLSGEIAVAGGVPPLAVTVTAGAAPTGVAFAFAQSTPAAAARLLRATGTAANGAYSWTLRIADSDGRAVSLPCTATFT